jgi:hypothetical protein
LDLGQPDLPRLGEVADYGATLARASAAFAPGLNAPDGTAGQAKVAELSDKN